METWRTANDLKSFSSIGKKRTKSTASFIVGACADYANVLPLCAIVIINLRYCIFLGIIAYIEISDLSPFRNRRSGILRLADRRAEMTGCGAPGHAPTSSR
ncbi:hypothetical protein [Burkholderia sp. LMG 32019]|uniref:hypothetical protein n=1 Tax=Burkholderia sp. LMG 32019 TaxID=3158173 RepID=UPI003C302A99